MIVGIIFLILGGVFLVVGENAYNMAGLVLIGFGLGIIVGYEIGREKRKILNKQIYERKN
jgi:membrane-bound ClpP family serine protease